MGKGTFLFSLSNLFTIQRWNNRPALLRFTEAENSFNTLFLSFVFLTINDEEKQLIENSLRWRLSRELPKIVLSDVSLQLKERIERFAPDVWNQVRTKALDDLKVMADEETVNVLVPQVLDCNPLDKLADLYISYLEAYENGKLYDYNQPLRELKEKIDRMAENVPPSEMEKYWQIAQYVWSPLVNLTSMVRWNRTHRNVRTSVSGHSFAVVTMAYLIAKLSEFEGVEEVIVKSILHDLPEAFTGDVITPTKKKVPGLDELVSNVEKEMMVEWISGCETMSALKRYIDWAVEPFSGEAGRIVRTADYLAALLECAVEIDSGNKIEIFRENFFNFKKLIKETSPIDVSQWIDEIESVIF
ncbi:HD domain-containing protein [Fervidobacterium islandicum]|uniref:HD domain-containing protein n=1 Tax=Fervidobacterium islandicum TaxID=2423 RepID=UPI003A6C4CC5